MLTQTDVGNNHKHNSNSNITGQSDSHSNRSRNSNSEVYVVATQGTLGFNILFTLTICKCVGPAFALFANPAGSIWPPEEFYKQGLKLQGSGMALFFCKNHVEKFACAAFCFFTSFSSMFEFCPR